MVASAVLDLPTGATVVCAFGLCLLALGVFLAIRPRALGAAALTGLSTAGRGDGRA